MAGICSNNKIIKEIFEFAFNNDEINSVSLNVPENKHIQNAIVKTIYGYRRTAFNLNSALHMRLVSKNKDNFKVLRKLLELIKLFACCN